MEIDKEALEITVRGKKKLGAHGVNEVFVKSKEQQKTTSNPAASSSSSAGYTWCLTMSVIASKCTETRTYAHIYCKQVHSHMLTPINTPMFKSQLILR